MIRKLLYISVVIILLLLAMSSFYRNKSLVIKLYLVHDNNHSRNLIYIKDKNMKIISEDKCFLYNSDSNTMSYLNTKDNTYWSGKVERFTQAITKFKLKTDHSFLINDVSFLRNLNTLNKNHFDDIFNRLAENKTILPDYRIFNNFNIVSTPDFTSVGGFAVRKYEITNSGKLVEEIWIAENLLTHIGLDLANFNDFLSAYFFHSGVTPFFNLNAYMEVRKNGLPMKVVLYHNNQKWEATMEHVGRKNIKDNIFSIPENYEMEALEKMLNINF